MQSFFSYFCYPLSLLSIPIYPPPSSPSSNLLINKLQNIGVWKERRKNRSVGSAKIGSALPLCFPTNLKLFPPLLSWLFRLQRLHCATVPLPMLPLPGQSSLMKSSWASMTLYQVPQGWQQLLIRHWLCPIHWRVNTATESHQPSTQRLLSKEKAEIHNRCWWHDFLHVTLVLHGFPKHSDVAQK